MRYKRFSRVVWTLSIPQFRRVFKGNEFFNTPVYNKSQNAARRSEGHACSANRVQVLEVLNFQQSCAIKRFHALEGRPLRTADHVPLAQPVLLLFH